MRLVYTRSSYVRTMRHINIVHIVRIIFLYIQFNIISFSETAHLDISALLHIHESSLGRDFLPFIISSHT